MAGVHEDYDRQHEVEKGSAKSFGIVFFVVFSFIGLIPLISGGGVRAWALAVAAGFLACAFVAPKVLEPLNTAWTAFGEVLHRIVSPVIMGVLFFGFVMPTGLLMRLFGKRPLALGRDPSAASYWILRDPPGPKPESLRDQF